MLTLACCHAEISDACASSGSESLTTVMEEQTVVGLSILHQPMHSTENILLVRYRHLVLLVIGQKHHIGASITKVLVQVCGHVLDVVDASSQGSSLSEVIDTDQEGFSLSGTI